MSNSVEHTHTYVHVRTYNISSKSSNILTEGSDQLSYPIWCDLRTYIDTVFSELYKKVATL